MAETLAFAKSLCLRLCGADRLRDERENYSRCRLIKTTEASMTPIASIPTAICPSAIESTVQARVVDPIKSGIGGIRKLSRLTATGLTSGVVTGKAAGLFLGAARIVRQKSMPVL